MNHVMESQKQKNVTFTTLATAQFSICIFIVDQITAAVMGGGEGGGGPNKSFAPSDKSDPPRHWVTRLDLVRCLFH